MDANAQGMAVDGAGAKRNKYMYTYSTVFYNDLGSEYR